MSRQFPPELQVKFWPPSLSAKGSEAIRAIRRPLAFAICMGPFVLIEIAGLLPGTYMSTATAWVKRVIGL
jgi:hypothetical protein